MRLELAGSLILPDPLVITYISNQNFDVQKYLDLDYTHFDVICIGAGGGMGGGIDTGSGGNAVRNYGGAGGGGGLHRVRGLLSALPSLCPVVVGVGGALGTDHTNDPVYATDGGDGGHSSFNDTTCHASGGKGGKKAQSNSHNQPTYANGGEGGVGNRQQAGGGALGGVSGHPDQDDSTDGAFGTLYQDFLYGLIGQGGGGGAGGIGHYTTGETTLRATAGGRGSYNPADLSVWGPGDAPSDDAASGLSGILAGGASGAKASPLNGLPTVYGQSKGTRLPGDPGVVIVRLTAE